MPISTSAMAWNPRAAFLVGLLFVSVSVFVFAGVFAGSDAAGQTPVLYGVSPGKANAEIRGAVLSLANRMIQAQWSVAEGKLTALTLVVRTTGAKASLPRDPFSVTFKDGTTVHASDMIITEGPQVEDLPSNWGTSRAANHFAGKAISLRLEYPGKDSAEKQDTKRIVSIAWRAVLRDDSNYIREEISLSAPDGDQPIAEVYLFNGSLPGASVIGTVKGSPAGRCCATGERPLTGFPPGTLGLVLLFPFGVLLMTALLGFLQLLPQAINLRIGPLQFGLLLP